MDLIKGAVIIVVSGGVVYLLGRFGGKARVDKEGWHHLQPSAMHWFACFGSFLFSAVLTYMAVSGDAFGSSPSCPCPKADGNLVAFWGLLVGFSAGAILMAFQIYQVYRRNLRWRDDVLIATIPDGVIQRNINAIAELRVKWTHEVELTFYDKSTLRIDQYSSGAVDLLQRIQSIYAPNWFFYETVVDNHAAHIVIDFGLNNAAIIQAHPYVTYLNVHLPEPLDSKLGGGKERKQLDELSDALCFAIKSDGRIVLAGRSTSEGVETFYFYSANKADASVISDAMAKWPTYQFESGTYPDPEWKTYKDFLFPSPEEMFKASNLPQIDDMRAKGDRIEATRTIEHFACFDDIDGRNDFAHYLKAEGFHLKEVQNNEDDGLSVHFEKQGALSDIDDITVALYKVVKKLNGDYYGWHSALTK